MFLHVLISYQLSSAYLNQFTLTYHTSVNGWSPQNCPNPSTAQVDDTTLDIRCSATVIAKRLTLTGSGVGVLCSLYINGGKSCSKENKISLKKETMSPSHFVKFSLHLADISSVSKNDFLMRQLGYY